MDPGNSFRNEEIGINVTLFPMIVSVPTSIKFETPNNEDFNPTIEFYPTSVFPINWALLEIFADGETIG